jgi:hypothetical protein
LLSALARGFRSSASWMRSLRRSQLDHRLSYWKQLSWFPILPQVCHFCFPKSTKLVKIWRTFPFGKRADFVQGHHGQSVESPSNRVVLASLWPLGSGHNHRWD